MTTGNQEGYCIDTNVVSPLIDVNHDWHESVKTKFTALDQNLVFVPAISIAEIEYGLQSAPKIDSARQTLVRTELLKFKDSVLNVDRHTAIEYGRIRTNLFNKYAPRVKRNHRKSKYLVDLREQTTDKELGIQENDLWIVSIAVGRNLILITRDDQGGMKKIVEAADYVERTQFWTK